MRAALTERETQTVYLELWTLLLSAARPFGWFELQEFRHIPWKSITGLRMSLKYKHTQEKTKYRGLFILGTITSEQHRRLNKVGVEKGLMILEE